MSPNGGFFVKSVCLVKRKLNGVFFDRRRTKVRRWEKKTTNKRIFKIPFMIQRLSQQTKRPPNGGLSLFVVVN